MGDVVVNGVRLHHEEHGHGAPILCVHGGGSSALLWEDALPALARLGARDRLRPPRLLAQ